jgi:hypothetical protein
MIPSWLVQLGSLAGLLAFCVTIWDRMLSARPLVWVPLLNLAMAYRFH